MSEEIKTDDDSNANGREQFLKIYKKDENTNKATPSDNEKISSEIKFRQDNDDED